MKLASFDLEIAKKLPEDYNDLPVKPNVGITCAAIAYSDQKDLDMWTGVPQLTPGDAIKLVHDLEKIVEDGYTLLTWNGTAFDFRVLAEESGLIKECSNLAMDHIDMMLFVTFQKGWFLGLDKALMGAGLSGKLHEVKLSDGSILDDMDGSMAPLLWKEKEYDAVLEYLTEDVLQPLKLAEDIVKTKTIRWISTKGNNQKVWVNRLYTVDQCYKLPEPDTSWMDNPPTRDHFTDWMD